MPNAFTKYPRHIQGRVLIFIGAAICVFAILFTNCWWSHNAPLLVQLQRSEIEILSGQPIVVGKNTYGLDVIEQQGRLAIPLFSLILLGVSTVTVGIAFLIIPKQEYPQALRVTRQFRRVRSAHHSATRPHGSVRNACEVKVPGTVHGCP